MRRFAVLAALLTLPTGRLAAQHAGQFEAGAFGSYTRYDAAFGLADKLGGGGRLGYFFGDAVGLEAEVLFQPQYTVSSGGTPTTLQPLIGGASLVFNAVHGSRLMVYLLGGYSLLDFGTRAPYRFTDNAMHGGAGVRIFLTQRVALRLEGRGVYVPSTRSAFGPTTATHFVATAGLSVFHLGGPPQDSDKDGIPDKKDACPNTPLGATVDATGCPTDSDKDGVFDGLDKCPGTPAGTEVDSAGCQRSKDTDGDGVDDTKDKCPGTAAGTRVDAAGCPILFTEAKTPVVLRGVTFETGRSALKPDSYTILDIVAASLIANPDIKIEISGHTDNTGSSATNTRLSQARADAVRTYLASKGVSPDRMVAKGYGASQAVAPNTTPAGRALNRRVELRQ